MTLWPVYPALLALLTTSVVAAVAYRRTGRDWGRTLALVGAIHAVGYGLISQTFAAPTFTFTQTVLRYFVVAIFAKFVVFSPLVMRSVADPDAAVSLGWRKAIVGVSMAWLLEGSIATIYAQPTEYVATPVLWVLPYFSTYAFGAIFAASAVLAQVWVATQAYQRPAAASLTSSDAPSDAAETPSAATADSRFPTGTESVGGLAPVDAGGKRDGAAADGGRIQDQDEDGVEP